MWARLRLCQFCLLILAAAPVVWLWFIFGLMIPASGIYRSLRLDPLYDISPLAATAFRYATWVGWIWDFAIPAACAATGLSWLMGVVRPIWQRRGIRVCWILSVINYLLALNLLAEDRKEMEKIIWVDLHLDLQFYSNGEFKPETDFAEWWATARDRPEWQPLPFYSLQKDPNSFRKDRDPIFDAQKLRHFFWSPDSLKYLTTRLKEGMDPNIRDEHGENKDALLTYAARHRRWQAMEMLLEAGADVNIRSVETIQTETINTPNVKFEMQRGTFGGKTPLFVAASLEGSDIVEFLIKHGADVNAIDDAGNNALREAILTDRAETIRILLNAGCNPDQQNTDGKTMRDLAVETGYPKIKELLMIKDVETLAK